MSRQTTVWESGGTPVQPERTREVIEELDGQEARPMIYATVVLTKDIQPISMEGRIGVRKLMTEGRVADVESPGVTD